MPRPLNERQSLEQERAEIPSQIAAYRQELGNGRPTKARREGLEWQIREREKRLAEMRRGWQKGKATGISILLGNFYCWLVVNWSALACRFVAPSITPGTATARYC